MIFFLFGCIPTQNQSMYEKDSDVSSHPHPLESQVDSPTEEETEDAQLEDIASSEREGLLFFSDFDEQGVMSEEQWRVDIPNCSGSGAVSVDDSISYSGRNSLHVVGGANYCDHVFVSAILPEDVFASSVHVRFWMRLANPLEDVHITFLTMFDTGSHSYLRMGGQKGIMMWNRESDDATLPSLSPTGIQASISPVSQEWMCVSFSIDQELGEITTEIDGEYIAGLQIDEEPTPDIDQQWIQRKPNWSPNLSNIQIGWEGYGQGAGAVWFDDVAISTEPIPCPHPEESMD